MTTLSLRKSILLLLTASFGLWSRFQRQRNRSPAEYFAGLKWRLIGPFRGGRAIAATGVPGDGTTFYFGAVDGGIWKTTDAGVVWNPIFDRQPIASIGALAVASSDPKIIYAGTGEADIRSNLSSGDGVYKSTDAGQTWQNMGLRDTRQISRIVVDPRTPILFTSGPSAMLTDRTMSAAYTNHPMAARIGQKFWIKAPRSEWQIYR